MEERLMATAALEHQPPTPGEDAGPVAGTGLDDPRALQILSTEHWSLLTARSLVYNESFTRAGMFFAILSATLVALGLISTGTGFSDAFLIVAAFVLALDLFIGFATLGRIAAVSDEELRYLQGMNRLRNAYFRIVPGLDPYFITSHYDDFPSVAAFYGPEATSTRGQFLHGLTTLPGMLSVVCAAITGALAGVVLLLLVHNGMVAFVGAVLAFLVVFVVMAYFGLQAANGFQVRFHARFPRPFDAPPPGRPGTPVAPSEKPGDRA